MFNYFNSKEAKKEREARRKELRNIVTTALMAEFYNIANMIANLEHTFIGVNVKKQTTEILKANVTFKGYKHYISIKVMYNSEDKVEDFAIVVN